ncbi:branched-chain amino acid transaminase [Caloramator sp. E03]|uniref:branched-chain amino acid transaminase n=1 Tax=Caloramator sp. E03 TaxID=2576307 RepID=UPI00110FFF57|nr:branched-chain amino acid transaminase [Caloramator sp. E03]QCX33566.1 branched-chain amino acid transaminase [Caloramator sp. E03]
MSEYLAFYQGEFVKEDSIKISIRSKAFNYGLGCFEGIRAYWNEEKKQLYVFRLKEHYERLLQSCKALNINIPFTIDQLCNATVELLKRNNFKTTVYIRPVAYKSSENLSPSLYDDDNSFLIYCQPLERFIEKEAFRVCISSWRRISDNMIPARTKPTGGYLNSALASLEAALNGYDEAIFLTEDGKVCEGPGENIFIYKNGKLITPPASDNILEGITRDMVMKIAKNDLNIEVVERSISRTELYAADEVFFTGTAMEVAPVIEVDRRIVGNGKPGEVSLKIREYLMNAAMGNIEKYIYMCTPVY